MAQPDQRVAMEKKLTTGISDLMTAAMYSTMKSCRYKIRNEGADVHAKTEEYGVSLMHFAAVNKICGVELVNYFNSLGLCVLELDFQGKTPIEYALMDRNEDVASEMVHLIDFERSVEFCTFSCKLELAKYFIETGIKEKMFFNCHMVSAFSSAFKFANLDFCKYLIGRFLSDPLTIIILKDAFHWVAGNLEHGAEIATYLTFLDFDMNRKDEEKKTPLFLALDYENFAVAENLLKHRVDLDTEYNKEAEAFIDTSSERVIRILNEWHSQLIFQVDYTGKSLFQRVSRYPTLFKWLYTKAASVPELSYYHNKFGLLDFQNCN